MPIPEDWIGRGWPLPLEPGVPDISHEDMWHWVAWPSTGVEMAMHWAPDNWMWHCTWNGNFIDPEEVAFLDYLGPARPPANPYPKLPWVSDWP